MKVKAVLWTACKRQDGSSQVLVYVYSKSKKKYYSIGIHVLPQNWSTPKGQLIRLPKFMRDSYNSVIESKKIDFLQKLSQGKPKVFCCNCFDLLILF